MSNYKKTAKIFKEADGATRHLTEQLSDKGLDEGVDAIIEAMSPYKSLGDIEKLYLDFSYRDRLSEITSFSYSTCP